MDTAFYSIVRLLYLIINPIILKNSLSIKSTKMSRALFFFLEQTSSYVLQCQAPLYECIAIVADSRARLSGRMSQHDHDRLMACGQELGMSVRVEDLDVWTKPVKD